MIVPPESFQRNKFDLIAQSIVNYARKNEFVRLCKHIRKNVCTYNPLIMKKELTIYKAPIWCMIT